MDYFNILGIKEGASKEEIRQAYEDQVNKFKSEVKDKKKLEKFLKLFKEAYDKLMKEFENKELEEKITNNLEEDYKKDKNTYSDKEINENKKSNEKSYDLDCTVKMSAEEIQEIIRKSKESSLNERHIAISKEEFLSLDESEYEAEEVVEVRKRSNDKSKAKNKAKKKNNKNTYKEKKDSIDKNKSKNNYNDEDDNYNENSFRSKMRNNANSKESKNTMSEQKGDRREKVVVKSNDNNSNILSLIKIPFKILALPIILILSVIIFLCKIINLTCFLVSKIIIIGAIGIASIHGYQIYTGHPMQWKIFALCALAVVVAFFLPAIVRVVPNILGRINTSLKNFVF